MSAPSSSSRVGVIGGGGFGRALATAAHRNGKDVSVWSRRGGDVAPGITRTTALAEVARADLLFLCVPSSHVTAIAEELGAHLEGRHLVVHVSRGLVGDALLPVSRVVRTSTAARRVGCLAGPLGAETFAAGTPGGGIVGTEFPDVADAVRESIGGKTLRLYETEDVTGVEVASAMVGLLALALGFAKKLGFGPGTLAVLMTRGLAEAGRVGVALGGEERTFSGVAGFGDLLAASFGDGRPEVALGEALATGRSLAQAAEESGAHVEGVEIARRVSAFASRRGIETPISDAIAAVVGGQLSPAAALERLMTRKVRRE